MKFNKSTRNVVIILFTFSANNFRSKFLKLIYYPFLQFSILFGHVKGLMAKFLLNYFLMILNKWGGVL